MNKQIKNDAIEDHDKLACYVADLIEKCEIYSDEQKHDRTRALEYYDGKMNDLRAEDGRSQSVSRDVRSVIRKLMPSVLRTLLSNEKIVEYHPLSPEDELSSQQATDYINHVILHESGARRAIYDSIFDALTVKTGIIKWVAYKRRKSRIHEYTNQPSLALLGLEGEEGVEIFDRKDWLETDPFILAINPEAERHDFKLRRTEERIDIRLEAIPRGSFLIYPNAVNIGESPIIGERQIVTRSELVSRGYNKDQVAALNVCRGEKDDLEDRQARQGDDWTDIRAEMSAAMEEVLLYEVYVKLDQDHDGIAELYKICLARSRGDGGGPQIILEMEAVDEAPYTQIVAEQEAHQFEGHSVAEDVMDIQRIKTALLRETLDNIYWQNKKQPAIDPSRLTESGMEAIYNPAFGKPILLKSGANVHEAIQWGNVPFVADKSFAMMSYLDNEAQNRTGITESAGGVNPELLKDMTKFAAILISESGIARAAMIIDTLSGNGAADGSGIARAFKGLLKLVIAHTDQPRTVCQGGKWVEYDPRQWNVEMNCIVNVGLGAGSKERDLAVLQMILGLQKELIAIMGANNPFVTPVQIYNVLEKITETAGFSSANPYFTKPDEEAIRRHFQTELKPSENDEKFHMQMELEKLKATLKIQIEKEQMEADLCVQQAELEKNKSIQLLKTEQEREIAMMKSQFDWLKYQEKMNLERQKAGLERPGKQVADQEKS
ncbi:MAG: hypothetical protein PSN37_04785 [Alphaproteobacteria bacterium]|nr:hypothetical protein [Alphaproteobacteria bacterium]